MKYYPVDALVIKAINYGENHRIFTLFSLEEGKISAIARGIKKAKNALKGHVQLGNRCDFMLYHGSSLDTISQAVAKETYPHIRVNPKAYLYSSYFMELLNVALPEREKNAALFHLTHEVFQALAGEDAPPLARYFELHLLSILGYSVPFHTCMACGKSIKEGFLSPRFPGVVCHQCGGGLSLSPATLYGLSYYATAELNQVGRLKVTTATAQEMAKATNHLLTYQLEGKMKSCGVLPEFF